MLSGLQKLPGDAVSDVSINPFLDLLVALDSGRRLRLFCDQSGHDDNEDSYRLHTPEGRTYAVITGLIERAKCGAPPVT